MALKLLESFPQVIGAEMAKSYLESYGIECEIHDAHIVSTQWLYSHLVGGVKLKVDEADYDKAKELLTKLPDSLNESELDGPECPNCNSTKTEYIPKGFGARNLMFLLWLIIPGFILPLSSKTKYICKSCQHEWSEPSPKTALSLIIQSVISVACLIILAAWLYGLTL